MGFAGEYIGCEHSEAVTLNLQYSHLRRERLLLLFKQRRQQQKQQQHTFFGTTVFNLVSVARPQINYTILYICRLVGISNSVYAVFHPDPLTLGGISNLGGADD